MRDDDFPTPMSDPEADGLPGTADDDLSASDEVETGREADGPDPAGFPPDRETGPLAMDRYGNTADEQLNGEPLDYKLAQERLDPLVDDPLAGAVDPALAGEADSDEAAAQAQLDADVIDPGPTSDPHSPVSIYDHGILGDGDAGRPVGRLVDPDEGVRDDSDTDAVGIDRGAAGGGATAEEVAVHQTEPPDLH